MLVVQIMLGVGFGMALGEPLSRLASGLTDYILTGVPMFHRMLRLLWRIIVLVLAAPLLVLCIVSLLTEAAAGMIAWYTAKMLYAIERRFF